MTRIKTVHKAERCKTKGCARQKQERGVASFFSVLLRSAIYVWLIAFVVSCGTETIPYLSPPSSISADPTFLEVSFRHPGKNDSDLFLGYEIYYKLYAPSQVPDAVTQDRNAVGQSPVRPDPSRLTSRGFTRLRLPRNQFSQDRPLAPIPRSATGDRVTVRFAPPSGDDTPGFQPFVFWPGETRSLRRNTPDDTGQYKLFFDETYQVSDQDVTSTVWNAGNSGAISIAFFALAFGRTPDLKFFYSEPVYLSVFELDAEDNSMNFD
jgi:hypothetical protein